MKRARYPAVMLLVFFLMTFVNPLKSLAAPVPETGDRLSVAGMVQNPQGRGIKEVEVEVAG